jgi:hypothetical protein
MATAVGVDDAEVSRFYSPIKDIVERAKHGTTRALTRTPRVTGYLGNPAIL